MRRTHNRLFDLLPIQYRIKGNNGAGSAVNTVCKTWYCRHAFKYAFNFMRSRLDLTHSRYAHTGTNTCTKKLLHFPTRMSDPYPVSCMQNPPTGLSSFKMFWHT